jgi:hypothetical protein
MAKYSLTLKNNIKRGGVVEEIATEICAEAAGQDLQMEELEDGSRTAIFEADERYIDHDIIPSIERCFSPWVEIRKI